MKQTYYDERRSPIGWSDQTSDHIYYYTFKHGHIGTYTISTKQYVRFKQRPGMSSAPFAGHDYGEADVYYWAEH